MAIICSCPATPLRVITRAGSAPASAIVQIEKIEDAFLRAGERVAGADPARVIARGGVAGQKQMIAVVDGQAKRSVMVGAAASTRHARRLIQRDAMTVIRQTNGAG